MQSHLRATWIETMWRDVNYATRLLRRSPRFTLTALTLLILGIGSTTAIFSIAHAVLVRPLPYPDAERLVFLAEKGGSGVAWPTFEDWRRRATSFERLGELLSCPRRIAVSWPPVRRIRRPPGCRRDRRDQSRVLDTGVRRRPRSDWQDDYPEPPVHRYRRHGARVSLHDAGGRVHPA